MAATRDTVLANFDDDGSGEGFITQSDQKTAAGQLWDYTKEVDNRTLSGGGGDLTTAAHALIDHTGIPGVGAGGGGDHPDADHADAFSPIGHDHDADYDTIGTAATAISGHTALPDPHPQYVESSDGTITDTVALTQAAYNALTPDATTHYLIISA